VAVYTVRIKTRPTPAKTTIRRRLRGNDRVHAFNALKHLNLALAHDARLTAAPGTIDGARLIFSGDATLLSKATDVANALADVLAQNLKIIKS
jgi:hypothetical protein